MIKNLPAMWETWIWSQGWEDFLEKAMATHSSILAGRILWTEEPGTLQAMASQRARHDWATKLSEFSWCPYEVDFIIPILQMTKGDLARLNNLPKIKSAVSDETRIQILAFCQQNLSTATAAPKSLQSCPTLCDPIRLPCPWDSPCKNTGVGCHFLLQGMKVKSESEVTQSCLTLSNPMDCSPPCSSVHGVFQARSV